MNDLPALSGSKSSVVGTYLAEQVSNASYELLSVQHVGQLRRPVTHGNPRVAAPGQPGGGTTRRRHVPEQSTMAAKLPSLSYSGLMAEGGKANGHEEPDCLAATDGMRWERISKSSSRLYRGERCAYRRGFAGTPSDEEVMKSLTQPLSCFSSVGQPSLAEERLASHGSNSVRSDLFSSQSPGQPRKRPRRHQNYKEVFHSGLTGTELEHLPLRLRVPSAAPPLRPRPSPLRGVSDSFKLSGPLELKVLPADPVEALFRAEEEQKASANKESEERHNLRSQGPSDEQLERLQPVTSRGELSARLHRAVYKDNGALAAAGDAPSAPVCPPAAAKGPGADGKAHAGTSTASLLQQAAAQATGGPVSGLHVCEIVDAVLPKQKLGLLRREASQLLRMFALGQAGEGSKKKGHDKDFSLQEPMGSKECVRMLYSLWERLDMDGSGSVDVQEFRASVERYVNEARAGEFRGLVAGVAFEIKGSGANDKFNLGGSHDKNGPEDSAKLMHKMCDRVAAVLLAKDRKSFVIEDMMRIIWPFTTTESLKQMKAWCDEFAQNGSHWRACTPCLLDVKDLEALQAVFNHFDKDKSGSVTAQELVDSGLLDKEVYPRERPEWGRRHRCHGVLPVDVPYWLPCA